MPSTSSCSTLVPLPLKKKIPVVKVKDGVPSLVENEKVDPQLEKHLADAITVSDMGMCLEDY
jgi:hypothetical protein